MLQHEARGWQRRASKQDELLLPAGEEREPARRDSQCYWNEHEAPGRHGELRWQPQQAERGKHLLSGEHISHGSHNSGSTQRQGWRRPGCKHRCRRADHDAKRENRQ